MAEQSTQRQREILVMIAQGKKNQDMALALGLSRKTVEYHKKRLMDQIGVRTTAELTRYAIANGFAKL